MDSDLDLLRLVFSFHVVDQIVRADDVLDPGEVDWVRSRFPFETLAGNGLIDPEHCLTPRYRDLLGEALMRLPVELQLEQKLELTLTFFDSAMSDGDFQDAEGAQIEAAANLLGVPMDAVHEALAQSDLVGDVELGTPETVPE